MKKSLLQKVIQLFTLHAFLFLNIVHAQEKLPSYFNSLALELANPISYAVNVTAGHNQTGANFPFCFIGFEARLKNRLNFEGATSFGFNHQTINDSLIYKNVFGAFYAGVLLKQKIFQNFFFTPSLDFYLSTSRQFQDGIFEASNTRISLGPTIGFEYFFSKRFSINTDIFNINLGMQLYNDHRSNLNEPFLTDHSIFTSYKIFSIGAHYNFDWKKKK